jgi:hypothetical protein
MEFLAARGTDDGNALDTRVAADFAATHATTYRPSAATLHIAFRPL